MPTAARRHSRVSRNAIWAAVGVALAFHGAMFGSVEALGLVFFPGGVKARAAPDPEVELQTSCTGDVLLATSARAAMCLAPWRGDLEGCGDELAMSLWIDLSGCRAPTDALAEVAMVEPRELAKLTPIDAEALLEELQQKPPEQQPPPVPQPQPQPEDSPPPPPPRPRPPTPRLPQQTVETAKPSTEQEAPENTRFASEYNTRVEKQTVARGAVDEPMVAKSKPESLAPKDKPVDDPSIEKLPDKPPGKSEKAPEGPSLLSMRPPGAIAPSEAPQQAHTRGVTDGAKGPIVSDGFVPRAGDAAIEQQRRDPGERTRGQGGGGGGVPPVPDLEQSKELLERIAGGGSVDHLEGIESGEETALNSRRWVNASFYNRLKRQVAQNWDPQSVWRRSDPNGNNHGFKTRVTEVRVTLTPKGALERIVVTRASGVSELDDEAVRAFHSAAPFPNPPAGEVRNGKITFDFSFYFEIGEPRTSWRVIRAP